VFSLVNVGAEAGKSALVLSSAALLALLDHIVVALKEVCHLALAELWIAQTTSRCGSAQHEVATLLGAKRGALVGIEELSQRRLCVYSLHIFFNIISIIN